MFGLYAITPIFIFIIYLTVSTFLLYINLTTPIKNSLVTETSSLYNWSFEPDVVELLGTLFYDFGE